MSIINALKKVESFLKHTDKNKQNILTHLLRLLPVTHGTIKFINPKMSVNLGEIATTYLPVFNEFSFGIYFNSQKKIIYMNIPIQFQYYDIIIINKKVEDNISILELLCYQNRENK